MRGMRVALAVTVVSCARFVFVQPAAAQPTAPTREEINRPPPPSVEQPRARLTVEGGVERAPCALDRPEYRDIRFTLQDVAFDDLHGLTAEQLRAAWAPYAGREHNVAVLCEIRDRAATMLREAGYIAAVEVPEQRIADGRVRFTVLMAKLVGIRVRGEAGRSERLIAGYLNRLTGQEVFNRFEAERYLLLAGDLPGYEVRLALRSAGAARGEVIGEVTVVHRPVAVDLSVQNLGSRELGRWGALLRGQIYGLTGLGDRTTVAVFTTADTDEQQTVQVGHDFRVGSEGLAFGAQLTYSWASPDLGLPNVEIDSRTLFATVEASYPFIRRQTRSLRGSVGLDLIDQDIEFNTIPLNRDRLRVAFARLNFDMLGLDPGNPDYTPAEPRWRLGFTAEARQGLSILGASDGCGPGLVNCLGPGTVLADPAGGGPDRDRPARRRDRRVPADAPAHLRLQPERPVQCASFVQLRGILGRQLHGRPRLRSGRPARRQRCRYPGRAALRAQISAPAGRVRRRALCLLRPCLGVERGCDSVARPPDIELGRRRRPRRLGRSLPDRRPRRQAARPAVLPDRARRHPLPRLVHHPSVAMEIKMTISAHKPVRPFKRALLVGCALAGLGGLAGRAQAQAFAGTPATAFGGVAYDRATPGVETITVSTNTAVINWTVNNAIFLPAGNIATFQNGPNNTDFVVLNRLTFNGPVRFDGTVLSFLVNPVGGAQTGGTVMFSAPNGMIIGGGALFDVGSLVLTSLFVSVDAGGNFYDAATRGITLNAGPSPVGGPSVVTEAGARINALQPNSYVAMIGQVVQHGGSVRVNGSAAYVAGEVVQFRANQGLFDIIVTTGSASAQPLTHTGSTGGPASTGAGDNHAIYLVAMPKNQAITAVLSGDIGFDPAVAVGVENGVIVLSAGANIVGGDVDRYGDLFGTPAPDLAASFEINGGTIRSDLIGVARTNIRARPQGGNTSITFQQDVSLFGGTLAGISVSTGQTVDVLGNAIVSAAAFDTITGQINLTGGQAGILTQDGGTIHIVGTATVDASARGLVDTVGNAGTGTGGAAVVNAAGGGTIIVDGALTIIADGEGGNSVAAPVVNGAAGTGGRATIGASLGGVVNANGTVTMSANGTASGSGLLATQDGAAGTGGIVNVAAGGAGTIVIAGALTANADGRGGDVPNGAGLAGGLGDGGAINITATDANLDFNADASFVATGTGGNGPIGGDGLGGDLLIQAERGTIDFLGQTNGATNGLGGGGLQGGRGGDGQGGTIMVATRSSDAPSRIGGGAVTLAALGQGGFGGNGNINTAAGAGGDGTGGTVMVLAESANGTMALGALQVAADGLGGTGGAVDNNTDGGVGGLGQGGEVTVGTTEGPAPGGGAPTGSATFASLDLGARGIGGAGGFGAGTGGAGVGGTVGLQAVGAPTTVSGATNLVVDGLGTAGGNSPGGAVGASGVAAGGMVNIAASAHPMTAATGTLMLATVTGSANAQGNGPANTAGEWHIGAAGGSAVNATDVTLTAAAQGPGIGVPRASTLDPQNGTITVTGTARLSTDGDIIVNATQAGRIAGGRYELVAGRDISINHATPTVGAFTFNVGNLFVRAANNVTLNAGVVTRAADITDIRALRLATISGRVLGREIRIGSIDLDLQATGAIGDAATELVILDVDGGDSGPLPGGPAPALGLGPNQFTVLGGTTQGPGYTLTTAEAGRIRSGTLRILVPALSTAANRAPDLIIRDLTVNGGGAAAGLGTLQVITPGIGRVEGNVLMANAGAADGLLLNARDRLEVVIPTASVRVRDAAGAPAGALSLVSNNLWIASAAIIDLLRADPNYAGRDDDLIDNDGVDAPRGYVEGNAVTLTTRGTLYVQNTTAARGTFATGSAFGGITTGAGGLTILADAPNVNVYAFGRRLNADGTFQTGDPYFFASTYNSNAGAGYTPTAALNTCIIVTGQCPLRVPPDTGVDGKEPFTGPTDGSAAIVLPQNDEDDVIDSSFAADPLIEEPVTSGSEPGLWTCDPDHDGDCDDQPR